MATSFFANEKSTSINSAAFSLTTKQDTSSSMSSSDAFIHPLPFQLPNKVPDPVEECHQLPASHLLHPSKSDGHSKQVHQRNHLRRPTSVPFAQLRFHECKRGGGIYATTAVEAAEVWLDPEDHVEYDWEIELSPSSSSVASMSTISTEADTWSVGGSKACGMGLEGRDDYHEYVDQTTSAGSRETQESPSVRYYDKLLSSFPSISELYDTNYLITSLREKPMPIVLGMITFGPDGNILEVKESDDSGPDSNSTWDAKRIKGDSGQAHLEPKGRLERCLGGRCGSFSFFGLRRFSSFLLSAEGEQQPKQAPEREYPKERKVWSCYSTSHVKGSQYETF